MLRTLLFVMIALVVVLTGLSQLGVNVGPLLAGASIFGVALGFGSQKLVQDFITGIFLLMENAMQVGDWVTLAGVSGTVEYLSIRTVRLRAGDGSLYTIPFSSVTTVNNTNRAAGNAAVKISIAYGEDIDRAIATLKEIGAALRDDPKYRDGILSDFSYWGIDGSTARRSRWPDRCNARTRRAGACSVNSTGGSRRRSANAASGSPIRSAASLRTRTDRGRWSMTKTAPTATAAMLPK